MHKARVALNKAHEFLTDAESQLEHMHEVREAIKKLKSDILFLMAILAEVEGMVIKFPRAGRAH